MIKNIGHTVFVLLFLAISASAFGQSSLQIDLKRVLNEAEENNPAFKVASANLELVETRMILANEWWKPNIAFSTGFNVLNGNAMNSDGFIFEEVRQRTYRAALGLSSEWDFITGVTKAKTSNLDFEAEKQKLTQVKNEIFYELIDLYYSWMEANMKVKTYASLVQQSDTIVKQLRVRVEAGLNYNTDLMLAMSNHNQLNLSKLSAENLANKYEIKLKSELGIPANTKLVATDGFFSASEKVRLNPKSEMNINEHPEIKSFEIRETALDKQLSYAKNRFMAPHLNLNTYTSYFGGIFNPMDPTSAVSVSLSWDLPTSRLTSQGKIKNIQAQKDLIQNLQADKIIEISSEYDVWKSEEALYQSMMKQANEALRYARIALNESMDRQELGTIRPFELFQAQQNLLEAQLMQIEVAANLNKTQFRYYLITGKDITSIIN